MIDPNLVGQHTERQQGVRGALVLEEQVEARVATVEPHGEEQIREARSQRVVYERATLDLQRVPLDECADRRGQRRPELPAGVVEVGERGFDERVVWR